MFEVKHYPASETVPIIGYEGLYEISDNGVVWSLNYKGKHIRRALKPGRSNNGYYTVALLKNRVQKSHSIHRLLCRAFIPNPDNLPQVNHRDGDKQNNALSNLEWCTMSHNMKHAHTLPNRKKLDHSNHHRILTPDQVTTIRRLSKGMSHRQIGKMYGVSKSCIAAISEGRTWKWLKTA